MGQIDRAWPGSTIVCIATGPSLTREDVEACRDKARVVVVNDAHRLAPWADALWATDGSWWNHHRGVPTFTGLKYGITVPVGKWPGVQVITNTGTTGLERKPTGVRTGQNSGYAAINAAVHLGARRILLLGYDMGRRPGEPSHFFGDHPKTLQRNAPYAAFAENFVSLVDPLAALGITVINCSRRTALTCFPQASLAQALDPQEAVA